MRTAGAYRKDEVLVQQHMDLVRRIAHHLVGRLPASVHIEDLVQAGAMGLLEAARQYDASHGASFETYAGIRIRGAMLDEVRRQDWSPRSAHRTSREISAAIHAVEMRTGRRAEARDIAQQMGVDLDEYHALLRKATESRVFNLEDLFGPDADNGDTLPGDSRGPAGEFEDSSLSAAVAAAIDGLPERERTVLALYYDEELNLREIGEVLGVTESRVCQIHSQALLRLRAKLTDWKGAGSVSEA
jgi:RNA polymerase sigma factor for flagellar operon FliA